MAAVAERDEVGGVVEAACGAGDQMVDVGVGVSMIATGTRVPFGAPLLPTAPVQAGKGVWPRRSVSLG